MMNMSPNSDGSVTVTSPVFIPDLPDCEASLGEKPLTADVIRRLEKDFRDYGLVDLEHQFFTTGKTIGSVVESQILEEPTLLKLNNQSTETLYPEGTWLATLCITDSEVVDGIIRGDYTGLSPTTINRSDANNLKMLMNTKSMIHRVLVSDIPDPVTVTVSVVESPCSPGARFCSLKNVRENNNNIISCECVKMSSLDEKLDRVTKNFLDGIKEIFRSEKSAKKIEDRKEELKKEEVELDVEVEESSHTIKEGVESVEKSIETQVESEKLVVPDESEEGDEISDEIEEDDDEEDNMPMYVTVDDLESFKEEIRMLIKPETESEAGVELGMKEEIQDVENTMNVSSKSIPVHENENDKPKLSDTATVYHIMGRTSSGSAKRR